MVLAAPWLSEPGTSGGDARHGRLVAAVAAAWAGPAFAPVAVLPDLVHIDDIPVGDADACGAHGAGIPIGVDEEGLARVAVDLDGRSAPALLRRRRERQDHPAAGARARARPGVRAGRGAHRGRRLPPRAARRGAGVAPARPRQHGRCRGGGGSRHRRVVARAASRGGRRAAGAARPQLVERAGGRRARRRLRPRRPRGWCSGQPAPAARGVPAAGQGRRAAPGRRPALRRGRPGAVRPAARPAAGARRPWAGDERQPGRGRAGRHGQAAGRCHPGRAVLVDRRRGTRRVQLAWMPPDGDPPDGEPCRSDGGRPPSARSGTGDP